MPFAAKNSYKPIILSNFMPDTVQQHQKSHQKKHQKLSVSLKHFRTKENKHSPAVIPRGRRAESVLAGSPSPHIRWVMSHGVKLL